MAKYVNQENSHLKKNNVIRKKASLLKPSNRTRPPLHGKGEPKYDQEKNGKKQETPKRKLDTIERNLHRGQKKRAYKRTIGPIKRKSGSQ